MVLGQSLLDGVEVIEGQDVDELLQDGRKARRLDVHVRECLVEGRAHVVLQVFVVSVEVALELDDLVATGSSARELDHVPGCFGPRAAEAHHIEGGDELAQLPGDADVLLCLERTQVPHLDRLLQGGGDARVAMAEERGAKGGLKVNVPAALDIPDTAALGSAHIERIPDIPVRGPARTTNTTRQVALADFIQRLAVKRLIITGMGWNCHGCGHFTASSIRPGWKRARPPVERQGRHESGSRMSTERLPPMLVGPHARPPRAAAATGSTKPGAPPGKSGPISRVPAP